MTFKSFYDNSEIQKHKAEKVLYKILRIDFFKQNSCTFVLQQKFAASGRRTWKGEKQTYCQSADTDVPAQEE